MELIFGTIIVIILVALIYFNRSAKSLDINNDGKIDLSDAGAAVKNAVTGATAVADINKDGVVDAKDAKAVVQKAKTQVKSVASKAKAAAKKATTRGRKPKVQK